MRLIQFEDWAGQRRADVVEGIGIQVLRGVRNTHELGLAAIRAGSSLHGEVLRRGSESGPDYAGSLEEGGVLSPLDHDDPAHCLVSGTGLAYLSSVATRDRMYQQNQGDETALTDTMRIFRQGLEGGKSPAGQVGVQPERFYKDDGGIIVRPGADLLLPAFAEGAGGEPELVGLCLIGDDRRPYRLGYALGNEFSGHLMERRNYLYLAYSELRVCCYGPELRVGELSRHLQGESRILCDGEVLWQQAFLSGEDNMCHSLENPEHHHFKHVQFPRPGDIHAHYFGTATLSSADGIKAVPGDVFETAMVEFDAPLRNGIAVVGAALTSGRVAAL